MATILTREELYALVWSEPIQKLAPRYGLSDRGFRKLCARYKIPVPPRGWWAKHVAGKRVKQPPLPPLSDPYRQKIRFETKPLETATDEAPPEVHPLIAFEQDAANCVSVAAEAELSHPLVLKTERLLGQSWTRRALNVRKLKCARLSGVDLSVVPGDALTWEQIRESNFDDKTAFPPGVIMDRELYKTEPIPCDDIPGGKK